MKRIAVQKQCGTCNGSGRVRTPESIAAEHAKTTGQAYTGGAYLDWATCPKCAGTFWVDGGWECYDGPFREDTDLRRRVDELTNRVIALEKKGAQEKDDDSDPEKLG